MVRCRRCGEWNDGDSAYCRDCGARLRVRRDDFLEGAGFGVFLIVVASLSLNYPGTFAVLLSWIRGWGVSGITPVPEALLAPIYWFFTAMGTWSIIKAVIRYFMGWSSWRATQDIVGGVFNFILAFLVQSYGSAALTWRMLFPVFLVFVGAQIIVSAFIYPRLR